MILSPILIDLVSEDAHAKLMLDTDLVVPLHHAYIVSNKDFVPDSLLQLSLNVVQGTSSWNIFMG